MSFARLAVPCLLVCLIAVGPASAQTPPAQPPAQPAAQPAAPPALKVGDAVPKFEVKDDKGEAWKSEEKLTKKLTVVYFYPGDMTRGCTTQACAFRDDFAHLKELEIDVVGVSGDTVENHQVFKKAHNLPFTLLADTEGKVAKAFGVPFAAGERSFNTTFEGQPITLVRLGNASRWTFVVDETGKVIYKDEQVNAAQDSQKILEFVKAHKAGAKAPAAS